MLTQTKTTANANAKKSRIGFRCQGPGCGEWIGDVRYVGPPGHAPGNLCFECWMAHWEKVEARAANGGVWTGLDEALWLACHGLNLADAASAIGSSRVVLKMRIDRMRRREELMPDWIGNIRRVCRDKQNFQEIPR